MKVSTITTYRMVQGNTGIRRCVEAALEDGKALDVTTIDLKGKTCIADYMVIASGTSSRHTVALADRLLKELKEQCFLSPSTEGMEQGDWVLVDAGDVIIHIFRQGVRELYNLEKMWSMPSPEKLAVIQ